MLSFMKAQSGRLNVRLTAEFNMEVRSRSPSRTLRGPRPGKVIKVVDPQGMTWLVRVIRPVLDEWQPKETTPDTCASVRPTQGPTLTTKLPRGPAFPIAPPPTRIPWLPRAASPLEQGHASWRLEFSTRLRASVAVSLAHVT